MKNYYHTMKEINKIISFCMLKGVQPHDLVTSIFDSECQHVETYKENNLIYVMLTYSDVHENGVNCIKMKYIYNNEKQLISVFQKIDSSNFKIQWDRNQVLEEMLNSLAKQLPKDSQLINRLRQAIPDDFKAILYPHLKIAS